MTSASSSHRIRWYVVVDGQRIPKTSAMRGAWPGYDATCSCGWDSKTGGALRPRVAEAIADHKREETA